MNTFNKNVGRTICIFLLLTLLYVGLCSGRAPEFSQDVAMVVEEFHEVNGSNYSILVAGADIEEKNAQFVLYDKEEKVINVWTVSEGEFFILKDGETFYFSATSESIVASDNTIKVHLTEIDSGYYSLPGKGSPAVADSPPIEYTPAVEYTSDKHEYAAVALVLLYFIVAIILPLILLFLIFYYHNL